MKSIKMMQNIHRTGHTRVQKIIQILEHKTKQIREDIQLTNHCSPHTGP